MPRGHPGVTRKSMIGNCELPARLMGARFYSAFRAPRLSRALAIINPRRSASSSYAASLSRKGNRNGGRPKGSPNKISRDLKEAYLLAANLAGGKEGLVGYLKKQR